MIKIYKHIFSISEIENDVRLQRLYWLWIFSLFYFLQIAWAQPVATIGQMTICPEYFQACDSIKIFPPITESWGYWNFIGFLSILTIGSVYYAIKKNWAYAHFLLLVVSAFKFIMTFVLSGMYRAPEFFITLPAFVWLFPSRKILNLKYLVTLLYFLSGVVKLHESWLTGSFFYTFSRGMPIFPDSMIPVFTNLAIVLELSFCWFLLSSKYSLRKMALIALTLFHIYSVILIGPLFMVTTVPLIWILFLEDDQSLKYPGIVGTTTLAMIFILSMIPFTIPGDHKLTYEGQALSVVMFDAERISHSNVTLHFQDGSTKTQSTNTLTSPMRNTRMWWALSEIKNQCKNPDVKRAEWKVVTSLNGGPYKLVVDETNACALEYKAFSKNSWIRIDEKIVGFAGLANGDLKEKETIHTEPRRIESKIVIFLREHQSILILLHILLSGSFGIFVLRKHHGPNPNHI